MNPDCSILCVGRDTDLLDLRCEVLASSDYKAQAVTVSQSLDLLGTETLDLVIIDDGLTAIEKFSVFAASAGVPILELHGVVLPEDLLQKVEKILPRAKQVQRG